MLKNLSQLEFKIAERVYHFVCDPNAPLHEVKDALFNFMKYIGQVEDNFKNQQSAQEAENPVQEKIEESLPEEKDGDQ